MEKISFIKNYKLFLFDTLDSTMNAAKDLAKQHSNQNLAIIAQNQTAGRGRFNRIWESGNENLYLSLVIPTINYNIHSMINVYQMSFVFSLSICQTIQNIIPHNSHIIKCKWPNDVFINDKKIAGILTESSTSYIDQSIKIDYLCVGMGVNIKSSISHLQSTCLKDININMTALNFFDQLLDNININLNSFKESGFNEIKSKWLKNAYKLQENIEVKNGTQTIKGVFCDIDDNGAILLKTDALSKDNSAIKVHIGDIL